MFNIFKKKPALHPDYPVVEGRYKMTPEWSIAPPTAVNRRIEEKNLVLWQPGITAWIIVWGNDKNETIDARLNSLKQRRAPEAFSEKQDQRNGVTYYTYRLHETSEDKRVAALYCYVFSSIGHVQMSVYFDKEADIAIAESLCNSIENEPHQP